MFCSNFSGEALMGDDAYGVNRATIGHGAGTLPGNSGVQQPLVIGGGNIFRGVAGGARGHGPRDGGLHGHAGNQVMDPLR